jgi:hypothetical protein
MISIAREISLLLLSNICLAASVNHNNCETNCLPEPFTCTSKHLCIASIIPIATAKALIFLSWRYQLLRHFVG